MEWYIPLLIVIARCCDVPLGTIRMIFVISGQKWTAVILGFFEVIIWALAVGGVIQNLNEPVAIIAFGFGFAAGTWIGMTIEQQIAVGLRIVEVINPNATINVTERLRSSGHRVTRVEGSGMSGPVEIAKMVLKRRDLPTVLQHIRTIAPEAFVSVERADRAHGAPGPAAPRAGRGMLGRLGGVRK